MNSKHLNNIIVYDSSLKMLKDFIKKLSCPNIGILKKPIYNAMNLINMDFKFYINQWDRLFWTYYDKDFFKLTKILLLYLIELLISDIDP